MDRARHLFLGRGGARNKSCGEQNSENLDRLWIIVGLPVDGI
jgi:hypothetical protein